MIFSEKNKRYKVNRQHKEDIELHEIFLDHLAKKKEEETELSERKLEVPLSDRIAHIVFGCFLFFLILLLSRVLFFQIIEGREFRQLSEQNKTRIQLVTAERGVIYDKNLNQLAWNSPTFDLVCDKRDLLFSPFKGIQEIEEIAQILGESPDKLKKETEESENPKVLLASNLSHQDLVLLETKIRDFTGCQIEESFGRTYVKEPQLFHVLGFTGKINKSEIRENKNYSITDYIGKSGIEKKYEALLRGEPGEIKYERDALGVIRQEKILRSPVPGKNLVLYLDSILQEKLLESLLKSMDNVGAEKAAAVALDPKTGGVLALVSIPAVDNNLLNQPLAQKQWEEIESDSLEPFLNRVISGAYLTGSTIKPLIAVAALEENIISPKKQLYCPLELCLFNRYSGEKECYKDWQFHGWTDIRRAIAESVNPFFYMIGGGYIRPNFADSRLPQIFEGLGDEKIKKWLTLFNWGVKTGIDLPGEIKGRVPDSEWKENYFINPTNQVWTIGDTYNLSIGQGYLGVTPLQVATAFSAVANGGTIYQPQLVQKIVDTSIISTYTTTTESTIGVEEIAPKVIRENFISQENIQVVKEGMRQAVTDGSARLLLTLPVKAAAKTGTAETPRKDHYHHWVTVFAPYDDPQIVLTVMIEEIKGLQSATLPVAKEVLDWYFKRK